MPAPSPFDLFSCVNHAKDRTGGFSTLFIDPHGDRGRSRTREPRGAARRAATRPSPISRGLPVPRRPRARHLRERRSRSGSALQAIFQTRRSTEPRADRRGSTHRDGVVATEAEALLTEQTFIKQVQAALQHPAARRQVVPLHRDQPRRGVPRVYFTRERHRRDRVYFGPTERQARARHARPAGQDLPAAQLRGPRAGPPLRLPPRLLHQALRGAQRRRVRASTGRGSMA